MKRQDKIYKMIFEAMQSYSFEKSQWRDALHQKEEYLEKRYYKNMQDKEKEAITLIHVLVNVFDIAPAVVLRQITEIARGKSDDIKDCVRCIKSYCTGYYHLGEK